MRVSILALLLGLITLFPSTAKGSGAELSLSRGDSVLCSGPNQSAPVLLVNLSGTTQSVAAGTVLTLSFSAPVTGMSQANGIAGNFSGNTATLTFASSTSVPDQYALPVILFWFDLTAVSGGTPVAVSIAVNPPGAINLSGSGNSAIIGIVDPHNCQAIPPQTVTVDDLNTACPTADEVAAFRAALHITFDSDPSSGSLVCKAADGSANLTRLQERTYQALRLMKAVPFDTPVPWTTKSLYDWFTSAVKGIRYRGDIGYSFCCDPAGVINIQTNNLGVLQFNTSEWLASLMVLLLHEARHSDGLPHTCGSSDQTLSELAAWGVQYYINEWMAFHAFQFMTAKLPSSVPGWSSIPPPVYYAYWFWGESVSDLNVRFCDWEGGLAASPRTVDFGPYPLGAPTAPRTVALTLTKGLPQSIREVTVAGTDAADFSVIATDCLRKTVPLSCSAQVQFTPGGIGVRTSELKFSTSSEPPQTTTVSLAGTGTAGSPTCSYTLWPHNRVVSGPGGADSFTLYAPPGCQWSASTADSWITVDSSRARNGKGTVPYAVAANPAAALRQGAISIAGQTFTVTQGPAVRKPQFTAAGVTNGASFQPGLTPGGIVTIFGTAFNQDFSGVLLAEGLPLPLQLRGTSVSINGVSAPLFALANVNGQEQINLQVPYEVSGHPKASLIVSNNGISSDNVEVDVLPTHPGIFTFDGSAGAILHGGTYAAVTPSNPAARGETVIIYATGLGEVSDPPSTGSPARDYEPLSRTVITPDVTIGGAKAAVAYSGLAPYFVGLYQVNATIPAGMQTGNAQVVISSNGTVSKPVTINIQ